MFASSTGDQKLETAAVTAATTLIAMTPCRLVRQKPPSFLDEVRRTGISDDGSERVPAGQAVHGCR